MTTVDHVIAACGSLRASWTWLADTTQRGNARRNQRALTESAKAKRNERAIQERAEKHALTTAVRIVGGGQPPANLAAIEARIVIADQVDQLAAELSLAIASVRPVGAHYTDTRDTDAKFTAALGWISTRAHLLTDRHLIDDAYNRLSHADRLAQSVAGEGPQRSRLAATCPACGRRALAWDTSSIEEREWHVLCSHPNCACHGVECPCRIPGRTAGDRHMWISNTWNTLAQQLEER